MQTIKNLAPYGTWTSPITSNLIVSELIALGAFFADGGDLYWLEGRPFEGNVLVRRRPNGTLLDISSWSLNVRSTVHEYGGSAYCVADGVVYCSNFADQRLYRIKPGQEPEPITPAVALRYADGRVDRDRNRIICVVEDHTQSGEARNYIAAVALDGSRVVTQLVGGNDFYAAPRLSPDGTKLAYITWKHPNMPWDETELYVATCTPDGTIANPQLVMGGKDESVVQPLWGPDGSLYFTSDQTNWWNVYRWDGQTVAPITQLEAEFAGPQWGFGQQFFDFADANTIIAAYSQHGQSHLCRIDLPSNTLTPIPTPYTVIDRVVIANGQAYLAVSSATLPLTIVALDLASGAMTEIKCSGKITVDPGYFSEPRAIEYPTTGKLTAHGLFYPPQNRDFMAPLGELPPLLVMIHGGPTAAASTMFNLEMHYWTSRGFAVLDVNYGGSTGYGRAYRNRLRGQLGAVDVDDSVNGAQFLARQGLVDGNRLLISGVSSGGYTALSVLTFRDTFRAGGSHYGFSDLAAFRETHKFESRYMDSLVGPYPMAAPKYRARSPIFHTDQLRVPMIFFQGLEDTVVLPSQTEKMVAALRAKGIPVAYVSFPGEQHGFRKAMNIKRVLEGELYFYGRILGFTPADNPKPVVIENFN